MWDGMGSIHVLGASVSPASGYSYPSSDTRVPVQQRLRVAVGCAAPRPPSPESPSASQCTRWAQIDMMLNVCARTWQRAARAGREASPYPCRPPPPPESRWLPGVGVLCRSAGWITPGGQKSPSTSVLPRGSSPHGPRQQGPWKLPWVRLSVVARTMRLYSYGQQNKVNHGIMLV